MSSEQSLDPRIAAYLAEGPEQLALEQRDAIGLATSAVAQRRGLALPWGDTAPRRLLALAAAVVALAVATAVIAPRPEMPIVGGPQPTTLLPTPGALDEPYPAPLREEPPAGAPDVPTELKDAGDPSVSDDGTWRYVDGSGDGRPLSDALVDLVSVEVNQAGAAQPDSTWVRVVFETASGLSRPVPDPAVEWIAYGVVFDNDSDGRPDMRFGMDTMEGDGIRAWATDLHAGTTEGRLGWYPDSPRWTTEPPLGAGIDRPNHGFVTLYDELGSPAGRFYVWSAVIRNRQIVSMDFAPDAGWIDGRQDEGE